ncbi:MAG: (d)CMP kinase [Candidatus Kapaibacterium sp.]
MRKIIIAIDGPAGSGKSTTAGKVADSLGYIYIDTGAMYRAATLLWLYMGRQINEANAPEVMEKCKITMRNSPDGQLTILNGKDVSAELRTSEVTKYVSRVSAMPYVREKLTAQQRQLGENGGVVMDGRDIGTVVFPNAGLKIFLVADVDKRAERRWKELKEKGLDVHLDEIKQQIIERDKYDSSREHSPLKKADDAIEVDTSNMTIEEQVQKVIDLAEERINLKH